MVDYYKNYMPQGIDKLNNVNLTRKYVAKHYND